ncbi:MAG: signal recognition particle protein, partial [Fusobacteriaceae bacterium]
LAPAEKEMKKVEAIIQSMTKQERKNPEILKASRKIRIAKGSGTDVSDINKLLKQFEQMKSMMKMFAGGKMPSMPAMPKGGFPGLPGMRGGRR